MTATSVYRVGGSAVEFEAATFDVARLGNGHRAALEALCAGPLFRGNGGWRSPGGRRFSNDAVAQLQGWRLAYRFNTRGGVAMAATALGRSVLSRIAGGRP